MCRRSLGRLLRVGLFVALAGFCLASTPLSFADGSPAGCSANRWNVDVGADPFHVPNGGTVEYTVTAFNNLTPFTDGCDAGVSTTAPFPGHGVVVQFCCPQPDGTPYPFNDFAPGHCTELSAASIGDNYPASAGIPTVYPAVSCVVTVNPGVSTANGIAGGGDVANPGAPNANKGTIHFQAGDRGFQIPKRIPVGINFCGDDVINQTCETCDGADFPDTAPASHGPCRTGDTCGVNSCTFCGDGIVNGGEQCDDGNANNDDSCRKD